MQGCFCVLAGPSGSAKSSVLSAILGDMLLTGGACEVCGTCALAPQEPWLVADTIRDNIVMGGRVDEQRYHMVRRLSHSKLLLGSPLSDHKTAAIGACLPGTIAQFEVDSVCMLRRQSGGAIGMGTSV